MVIGAIIISTMDELLGAHSLDFLIALCFSLICGILIGGERELRGKPAGLSTQTLVISGSMIFAFMSPILQSADPTRIAAQIVSGIGFLGAGIILKNNDGGKLLNVTTAATIWYSAAVGLAIGFQFYFIAVAASVYAVIVSSLPRKLHTRDQEHE